jgi:hypothetical protein
MSSPLGLDFFGQLRWHRDQGTAPELGPKPRGPKWTPQELTLACFDMSIFDFEHASRTVRRWFANPPTPPTGENFRRVRKAYFGSPSGLPKVELQREWCDAFDRSYDELQSREQLKLGSTSDSQSQQSILLSITSSSLRKHVIDQNSNRFGSISKQPLIRGDGSVQDFSAIMHLGTNYMTPGAAHDDAWLAALPAMAATAEYYAREGRFFRLLEMLATFYGRHRHCSRDFLLIASRDGHLRSASTKMANVAMFAVENCGIDDLLRGNITRIDSAGGRRDAMADMRRAYGFEDDVRYRLVLTRFLHSSSLFAMRSADFRQQLKLNSCDGDFAETVKPLYDADIAVLIQEIILEYRRKMNVGEYNVAEKVIEAAVSKYGNLRDINLFEAYPAFSLFGANLRADFGVTMALGNLFQNAARYYTWVALVGNEARGAPATAQKYIRAASYLYQEAGAQVTHATGHILSVLGMLYYVERNLYECIAKLEEAAEAYRLSVDLENWAITQQLMREAKHCDTISPAAMHKFLGLSDD